MGTREMTPALSGTFPTGREMDIEMEVVSLVVRQK